MERIKFFWIWKRHYLWLIIYYKDLYLYRFLDGIRFDSDRKSILEFLKIDPMDLLELNLRHKELYRPSYFIARDKQSDAIILSIRGTMNVADGITDLDAHYIKWKNGLVHSGIYSSAKWIMDNVIYQIFEYKRQFDCSKIIITGHSLGGAISGLLGLMLNDEHDDVFCYNFGPPPVISTEIASLPLSKKNNYTYIFGNDIVPHLSYGSLMDFRMLLLASSKYIQSPKVFKVN